MRKTQTMTTPLPSNLYPDTGFADLLDRMRRGDYLDVVERGELWLLTSKFVQKTVRSHYGRAQTRGFRYKPGGVQKVSSNPLSGRVTNDKAYEFYMTRMTRFFDFALAYGVDTNPAKWIMYVWRRRTALIELVIESEVLGIGVYPADLPFHKRVTYNVTKKLVEGRALLRKLDLLPTDYGALEDELSKKHTKKYVDETVELYKGYAHVAFPFLFPELFEPEDSSGDSV